MSFSDQVVGGQYTISGDKPRIIIYQGKAINNTGMIDFFMYKCCKTSGVETPRGRHVDYRRCEGNENIWICIRARDRRILLVHNTHSIDETYQLLIEEGFNMGSLISSGGGLPRKIRKKKITKKKKKITKKKRKITKKKRKITKKKRSEKR